MEQILKCSGRPWKIAERIKDYNFGFTDCSSTMLKSVNPIL